MIQFKILSAPINSSHLNAVIVKILHLNLYIAEIKTFSGKANDIWALGVTLFALIYNELPFWADTELGVLEEIHKTDLKLLDKRHISDGLKRILLRMLDKNLLTRASLDELKKDKWLNEGYAVSLDSKEADFFANYTEDELIDEGIPLAAIVNAKKLAKKWAKHDLLLNP
jgi:serine/threonine protein kinase